MDIDLIVMQNAKQIATKDRPILLQKKVISLKRNLSPRNGLFDGNILEVLTLECMHSILQASSIYLNINILP